MKSHTFRYSVAEHAEMQTDNKSLLPVVESINRRMSQTNFLYPNDVGPKRTYGKRLWGVEVARAPR